MSVLIYGATGFTGALIARGLHERGVPLVISGRDRRRLEALSRTLGSGVEVRPAPVHDRAALAQAMAGVRLVVSCAGPFGRIGEPVVAAAVERRVPYLDIAGEQSFLRDMYERYESAARSAGILVASGVAFQGALGDLAAHQVARALGARGKGAGASANLDAAPDVADADAGAAPVMDELIIAYALNRFRATAGTRQAAADDLAGPSWIWSGDRWDPVAPLAERRLINFGPAVGQRATLSFPSAEVITIPRHTLARRVQSYISLADTGPLGGWMARLAPVLSPALPALLRSSLAAQARARLAAPAAPSQTDRRFATFAIAVEARRGFEHGRLLLTGADPYGITAALVCHAVERVLAGDAPTGVRSPAELLDPAATLALLAERCGVQVEEHL